MVPDERPFLVELCQQQRTLHKIPALISLVSIQSEHQPVMESVSSTVTTHVMEEFKLTRGSSRASPPSIRSSAYAIAGLELTRAAARRSPPLRPSHAAS